MALLISILIFISVASLLWAIFYPILVNDLGRERIKMMTKKLSMFSIGHSGKRGSDVKAALKRAEQRSKGGSIFVPMELLLSQVGSTMAPISIITISIFIGVILFLGAYIITGSLVFSFLMVGIGFVMPRLWLLRLRSKRLKAFVVALPVALDIVTRGVKAGLAIGDTLRIISREAEEPLRSEIIKVLDSMELGMTLPTALVKMYERVPVKEANFFAVIMAIQQYSGGNLAGIVGSFADMMRARAKMEKTVRAAASEGKTTGIVLASLPFLAAIGIFIFNRSYVTFFLENSVGNKVLMGASVSYIIGAFVLWKMSKIEV